MKLLLVTIFIFSAFLGGCQKKEATPAPTEGSGGTAPAAGQSAASQNGGAAFGPDGKPLTGVGK